MLPFEDQLRRQQQQQPRIRQRSLEGTKNPVKRGLSRHTSGLGKELLVSRGGERDERQASQEGRLSSWPRGLYVQREASGKQTLWIHSAFHHCQLQGDDEA